MFSSYCFLSFFLWLVGSYLISPSSGWCLLLQLLLWSRRLTRCISFSALPCYYCGRYAVPTRCCHILNGWQLSLSSISPSDRSAIGAQSCMRSLASNMLMLRNLFIWLWAALLSEVRSLYRFHLTHSGSWVYLIRTFHDCSHEYWRIGYNLDKAHAYPRGPIFCGGRQVSTRFPKDWLTFQPCIFLAAP